MSTALSSSADSSRSVFFAGALFFASFAEEVAAVLLAVASAEAALASLTPLLHNDLQAPALSCAPQLEQTLNLCDSEGVYASLVSGSGPTVLLLVSSQARAEALAASLRAAGNHAVATEVTSA